MKILVPLLALLASMVAFGEYRGGSLDTAVPSGMPEIVRHSHGDEPHDDEPEDDEPDEDDPES